MSERIRRPETSGSRPTEVDPPGGHPRSPRAPERGSNRRLAVVFLGVCLVLLGRVGATAHELRIVPIPKAPGQTDVIPVVAPGGHLDASPDPLEFGSLVLGETRTLDLAVSNVTASQTLTVEIAPAAGLSLSTTSFDLAPAAEQTVAVTWTPTVAGALVGALAFTTTHAGPKPQVVETVAVRGEALTPGHLELRDAASGLPISGVDFGQVTVGLEPRPYRDVLFVNTGQAPLERPDALGFYNIIGGNIFGNCSLADGNYFCFGDPGGDSSYLLVGELDGLPGGASLPVRVHFFPEIAESFTGQLSLSTGQQALDVSVSAEVVPYLLGDPFEGSAAETTKTTTIGGDFVIDVMAPRLARGAGLDRLFSGVGELDQVNLLNGNLTLEIPIGGTYPVGGGFSYGLRLSYNSNVWERWLRQGESQVFAPQSGANAGVGWTIHLGRLCGPTDWNVYRQLSRAERDKMLCRGSGFQYITPSGARHTFHRDLHSDGSPAGNETEHLGELFTQDGSYLRMQRLSATSREIEFSNGMVHTFTRKELSQWGDSWPDRWRLTEMRDRNGNAVTVHYEPRSDGVAGIQWRIADPFREQKIFLARQSSGYYPYRVDKVELAVFGGTTETWDFAYVDQTVDRPFEGQPIAGTFTVPVLDTLTLPDATEYHFDYYSGGGLDGKRALRVAAADLPTGGRLEWTYTHYAQPLAGACLRDSSELPDATTLLGVYQRTALDEAGGVIDQKSYLPQLYAGDTIATDYCDHFANDGLGEATPWAEAVTALVAPLDDPTSAVSDRNLVTLSYFSVFPIVVHPERNGVDAVPEAGGWTGADFGLPYTRNGIYDPTAAVGEEEFLSTELYECGSETFTATQDPKTLVADCTKLRSSYVRFGRSPKYCSIDQSCPPANRRLVASREVFHDDGDHWRRTESRQFDGLGNFRTTEITASWGEIRRQTTFTNYNPLAGELISDGETLQQGITLPTHWVLDTYNRQWVQGATWDSADQVHVNLSRRGGERCWTIADDRKTLDRVRTWADAGPDEHDVIVAYSYDGGDRTQERYYGADLATVPKGDSWCGDGLGVPQYTFDHGYENGSLATSQTVGTTYFTVDRTIDPNTGLVASERDSGGLETTYAYDALGRTLAMTPEARAGTVYTYELPGVDGVTTPRATVIEHPVGQPTTVLTELEVTFDALGQVVTEKNLAPGGVTAERRFEYGPRGWLLSSSTQQDSSAFDTSWLATFEYDPLGRATYFEDPHGDWRSMFYTGERQTLTVSRVATSRVGGVPEESNVNVTRSLDLLGRVETLQTPDYWLDVEFDSLGQITESKRRAGSDSQKRTFVTDGLGFLRSESHPEKVGLVAYWDYDALGHVGVRLDGGERLRFTYDAGGRRTLVEFQQPDLSWRPVKTATYYSSGTANGRLHLATRTTELTADNTAGAFPSAVGSWEVTEEMFYGSDGQPSSRQTQVVDAQGQTLGSWSQGWTWTDLGRVDRLTYPAICDAGFTQCDPSRTVDHVYDAGRLTEVVTSDGLGATLTYHPTGLVDTVTHGNGLVDSYGLDSKNLGRVASVSLAGGAIDLGTYGYDGSGNLVTQGDHSYVYDPSSRLTDHHHPDGSASTWRYDGFDNLTTIDGVATGISGGSNRLAGEAYDDAGRQLSDLCTTVHYGPMGLLRTYDTEETLICDAETWVHLYTADDRRLLTGSNVAGFDWAIRDLGGKILSRFRNSGPSLAWSKDTVYRGSRPIASREQEGVDTVVRHLHLDHLGTPRAISEGSQVTRRDFGPFGESLGDSLGESIQFTGHERDASGRTTNMMARTYSSSRGRFLSTDPGRDGWNLYAYAGNNPLLLNDPDGRADDLAVDLGGVEVGIEPYLGFDAGVVSVKLKVKEETDVTRQFNLRMSRQEVVKTETSQLSFAVSFKGKSGNGAGFGFATPKTRTVTVWTPIWSNNYNYMQVYRRASSPEGGFVGSLSGALEASKGSIGTDGVVLSQGFPMSPLHGIDVYAKADAETVKKVTAEASGFFSQVGDAIGSAVGAGVDAVSGVLRDGVESAHETFEEWIQRIRCGASHASAGRDCGAPDWQTHN